MVTLIFLNLRTTLFRLVQYICVVFRYYPRFLITDVLLAAQYFVHPPYKISKRFLRQRGELDLYSYGETPLTTLDYIARKCHILSKDCVVDLGCGTGRTSFWMAQFIRCRVIGVDYLPTFIRKARNTLRWTLLDNLTFYEQDMLNVDLTPATVIYLYGTLLQDSMIYKLCDRFAATQSRVISVSYPLCEYDNRFCTVKEFSARFPWGKAQIYLNVIGRAHA
ncbi:MAG: class I SAM-dependent methyltransferase [Chlamydiales bacterium]